MAVARGVLLFALATACGPEQYAFVAPSLPIDNPLDAPLPERDATAIDGLTKHRWKTFSSTEACFESRLNDLKQSDFDPHRPFLLMAFRDRSQPVAKVPTIRSGRVTVTDSGRESVKTEERIIPLFHVTVEACFPNPGDIIMPSTAYVVLRVPYSTDSDSVGAGTRDGVWRLQSR